MRHNWAECHNEKHAKKRMGVIFLQFFNLLIFVNFDMSTIDILRNCYKNELNIPYTFQVILKKQVVTVGVNQFKFFFFCFTYKFLIHLSVRQLHLMQLKYNHIMLEPKVLLIRNKWQWKENFISFHYMPKNSFWPMPSSTWFCMVSPEQPTQIMCYLNTQHTLKTCAFNTKMAVYTLKFNVIYEIVWSTSTNRVLMMYHVSFS